MRFLALVVALPGFAMAQAAPSTLQWTLRAQPEDDRLVASTLLDGGVRLAIRCQGGSFDVLLSNLPAIEGEADSREIIVALNGVGFRHDRWRILPDRSVALSEVPAPLARGLRSAGQLQVQVLGPESSTETAVWTGGALSDGTQSINEVLEACDRSLEPTPGGDFWHPLDSPPRTFLEWRREPRPQWPRPVRYSRGYAIITCSTGPDWRPTDCVVEKEHPQDGGFGQAALDAAAMAELSDRLSPDDPPVGARLVFRVNFVMPNSVSRGLARHWSLESERMRARREEIWQRLVSQGQAVQSAQGAVLD